MFEAAAATEKEAGGRGSGVEGNVEGGDRQQGRGTSGRSTGERRRGHAARARERVCVRLINQTFAFGILAREKEEEIAEEEVWRRGARGRTRRRRRRCRPSRVEHEARAGPS